MFILIELVCAVAVHHPLGSVFTVTVLAVNFHNLEM